MEDVESSDVIPSMEVQEDAYPIYDSAQPSKWNGASTASITVDPILTRLNGANGLTTILLPGAASAAGFSPIEIDEYVLVPERSFSFLGFTFSRRTILENIEIRVPVSSTSISANFASGNELESSLDLTLQRQPWRRKN